MTREEVAAVASPLYRTAQPVAKLLYGRGCVPWTVRLRVNALCRQALSQGHGGVHPPHVLTRKYPNTAREWGWQYIFPVRNLSVDPHSGVTHRHHVDPNVINKAIKEVVSRAGLTKTIGAHTSRPSFAAHLLQRGMDIRTIQLSA